MRIDQLDFSQRPWGHPCKTLNDEGCDPLVVVVTRLATKGHLEALAALIGTQERAAELEFAVQVTSNDNGELQKQTTAMIRHELEVACGSAMQTCAARASETKKTETTHLAAVWLLNHHLNVGKAFTLADGYYSRQVLSALEQAQASLTMEELQSGSLLNAKVVKESTTSGTSTPSNVNEVIHVVDDDCAISPNGDDADADSSLGESDTDTHYLVRRGTREENKLRLFLSW